ncbi:MAG TPA: PstS family phosphate ABC transporter substrate-binding protein [Deltaproteobacteria bacterium]|jgi:phosphate transport system substrate-binding protein|nr:PstS family phosphate ABC transporter substrate-binding protein [Deltaproteobacteria bacterium]
MMQVPNTARLMNISRRFLCLIVLLPALSCSDPEANNIITIKGSTTVLPVAQIGAEVFMDRHPGADISVQGGGSGVGIASLIDGTTQIATSSRKIKKEETAKAKAAGVHPFETIVAMDGIAVAVNPSNSMDRLTTPQIRDIYTGKVSNWKEIGGDDREIVVISRDTSSGTFEAFEKLALDGQKVRPDALVTASNQVVNMTVAQTPGAIGYLGYGYLSDRVRAASVDGVRCSEETIRSGRYPLARPLYIYTNGRPTGEVERFIDFLLSEEGQRLVKEQGFISARERSL